MLVLELADEDIDVTQKTKGGPKQTKIILGAVIIIAVAVAAVLVIFSSQPSFSEQAFDYSQIPQNRTDDGAFILGDPAAPITIVAFEDFLCGHCQTYKSTVDQLISQYVAKGMARFEYRFTPVVDPAYSRLSAQLAECSDTLRPGSFWNAHDLLYELASARRFNDNSARSFADEMNMPYADLLECSGDATQVDIDTQFATQLQVRGTPTVFFRLSDGVPQPSPFSNQPNIEQLGALIE
ncbi:MAG: thioredoxin domain-containing protein, partial [Chloroflexi bacterium]|nr:thioredoxin domain-containing protein [Chloroflexota bacterium]